MARNLNSALGYDTKGYGGYDTGGEDDEEKAQIQGLDPLGVRIARELGTAASQNETRAIEPPTAQVGPQRGGFSDTDKVLDIANQFQQKYGRHYEDFAKVLEQRGVPKGLALKYAQKQQQIDFQSIIGLTGQQSERAAVDQRQQESNVQQDLGYKKFGLERDTLRQNTGLEAAKILSGDETARLQIGQREREAQGQLNLGQAELGFKQEKQAQDLAVETKKATDLGGYYADQGAYLRAGGRQNIQKPITLRGGTGTPDISYDPRTGDLLTPNVIPNANGLGAGRLDEQNPLIRRNLIQEQNDRARVTMRQKLALAEGKDPREYEGLADDDLATRYQLLVGGR